MKPKCANPKCENEGWVYIYGKFYCGNCVKRVNDKLKEQEEKLLEE